ncbi:MAG: PD40 domain-containing protein [Spirochaetes bacterium]|nr:PD40 domain-containing protein [Spirochaetota bacterium]
MRFAIFLTFLSVVSLFGQLETFGPNINTPYDELAPVISPDGLTLYFVRQNHPENKLEGKRTLAIWMSELDDKGVPKLARRMSEPFNNTVFNSLFSVTPEGSVLILGAYDKGVYQGSGFSIIPRTPEGGWGVPQKIVIQGYDTLEKNRDPNQETSQMQRSAYLANDEKTLFFSASSGSDENDSDIYVTLLSNGVWTKPLNLGTPFNSEGNEITPFLASDGETMYFSSDRKGNHDIYISRRLGSSWTRWSQPVALPAPINSSAWEAYFSIDARGEYAYVVSYQNPANKADIVRVKMREEYRPKPVVLKKKKEEAPPPPPPPPPKVKPAFVFTDELKETFSELMRKARGANTNVSDINKKTEKYKIPSGIDKEFPEKK